MEIVQGEDNRRSHFPGTEPDLLRQEIAAEIDQNVGPKSLQNVFVELQEVFSFRFGWLMRPRCRTAMKGEGNVPYAHSIM